MAERLYGCWYFQIALETVNRNRCGVTVASYIRKGVSFYIKQLTLDEMQILTV